MGEQGGSMLMNLSTHLLVEIVSKVAESGFEELGQFISSCRQGRSLGKNKKVMKGACLKKVELNPELINMGSPYRLLFYRCFKALNPSAFYLESLRLVLQLGYIKDTYDWLCSVDEETLEMKFARGMVEITLGECIMGLETLTEFKEEAGSLGKAEEIANKVYQTIRAIGIVEAWDYFETWWFKGIPKCAMEGENCDKDNRCSDYFIWWRSIEFLEMF